MNWTTEETLKLEACGWNRAKASGAYYKGNELILKVGNIIRWVGKGRIYNPSLLDFEFWLNNPPVFYKP